MLDQREWVVACQTGDIDEEDVVRFDHGAATFAVYRVDGRFYASDGWCTHEKAHLADGFVLGNAIECPRHQGREAAGVEGRDRGGTSAQGTGSG